MTEDRDSINFGSSDKLLAFIKERSDDIEKVVILPPGTLVMDAGKHVETLQEFQMMLFLVNNRRTVIGQQDTELLLNDGILNRMKISIEFFKGSGQQRDKG
jgi:hypothetical protein